MTWRVKRGQLASGVAQATAPASRRRAARSVMAVDEARDVVRASRRR